MATQTLDETDQTHLEVTEQNQTTSEDTANLPPSVENTENILGQDEVKVESNPDLTHQEVMNIVRTSLGQVLQDPLLCDLPSDVTTEEINLQLALEYGQAMTVNVRRQDGEVLPVVVLQGGTVEDLKQALKRHIVMKQKREGNIRAISWRYTWRTYWLAFQGQKLDDDNRKIKDYGIRNKDEICFMKRLNTKEIGY
ncbi:U11/U12 small nuclear ribonucleoprotein 25 kDa protein-like [Amphiura filiformis]|uniref:U11/U12 small nuclear ribonucleoprotein 25 kDa protein-like n=1 Tax=Amphiura filiformis TaxID=82378 RepID=UPI003B222F58